MMAGERVRARAAPPPFILREVMMAVENIDAKSLGELLRFVGDDEARMEMLNSEMAIEVPANLLVETKGFSEAQKSFAGLYTPLVYLFRVVASQGIRRRHREIYNLTKLLLEARADPQVEVKVDCDILSPCVPLRMLMHSEEAEELLPVVKLLLDHGAQTDWTKSTRTSSMNPISVREDMDLVRLAAMHNQTVILHEFLSRSTTHSMVRARVGHISTVRRSALWHWFYGHEVTSSGWVYQDYARHTYLDLDTVRFLLLRGASPHEPEPAEPGGRESVLANLLGSISLNALLDESVEADTFRSTHGINLDQYAILRFIYILIDEFNVPIATEASRSALCYFLTNAKPGYKSAWQRAIQRRRNFESALFERNISPSIVKLISDYDPLLGIWGRIETTANALLPWEPVRLFDTENWLREVARIPKEGIDKLTIENDIFGPEILEIKTSMLQHLFPNRLGWVLRIQDSLRPIRKRKAEIDGYGCEDVGITISDCVSPRSKRARIWGPKLNLNQAPWPF